MKFVKQLLQELDAAVVAQQQQSQRRGRQRKQTKKNRKRSKYDRSPGNDDDQETVAFQETVKRILSLDKIMMRKDGGGNGTKISPSPQVVNKSDRETMQRRSIGTQSLSSTYILGNSRSSSSTFKQVPIPTITKKRYQRQQDQQQQQRLRKIARLLKESSSKKYKINIEQKEVSLVF
jgi:hypothetical protein